MFAHPNVWLLNISRNKNPSAHMGKSRGLDHTRPEEAGGRREPNRALDSQVGTCEWLWQQQQGSHMLNVFVYPFVDFGGRGPSGQHGLPLPWLGFTPTPLRPPTSR